MIDPLKSHAAPGASEPNGSSQPISQELINQLLISSLLGRLDKKDLDALIQKLTPLESQIPDLKALLQELHNPNANLQVVLTKITGKVAQAFIQSDPHMTSKEKDQAIYSINKIMEEEPPCEDKKTWPAQLIVWNAQLVSCIVSKVPDIIPKSAQDKLNQIVANQPPCTDDKIWPAQTEIWSTQIATCLAESIPGALSHTQKEDLDQLMTKCPPDKDSKAWPAQVSAWSAEVHEKIEDAFFPH